MGWAALPAPTSRQAPPPCWLLGGFWGFELGSLDFSTLPSEPSIPPTPASGPDLKLSDVPCLGGDAEDKEAAILLPQPPGRCLWGRHFAARFPFCCCLIAFISCVGSCVTTTHACGIHSETPALRLPSDRGPNSGLAASAFAGGAVSPPGLPFTERTAVWGSAAECGGRESGHGGLLAAVGSQSRLWLCLRPTSGQTTSRTSSLPP